MVSIFLEFGGFLFNSYSTRENLFNPYFTDEDSKI